MPKTYRTSQSTMDRHIGPRSQSGQRLKLLIITLSLIPFLYDGTKVTMARWSTLFGPKPVVSTPAFDLVESYVHRSTQELRRMAKIPFRKLPWRTEWAVGLLVFSLGAGTLIMRYGQAR